MPNQIQIGTLIGTMNTKEISRNHTRTHHHLQAEPPQISVFFAPKLTFPYNATNSNQHLSRIGEKW